MLIEGELEDIGVKAACHWAKQVVDVEYDSERVSQEQIKRAIAQAGYTVVE